MSYTEGAATFRAAADAYARFVGRYSASLSAALLEAVEVQPGDKVLDVGCGPGGLAAALSKIVGGENVSAADPSEPFVDMCRERLPEADARVAAAEDLPFADDAFDAAFAQLVVNFMSDPVQGVGEMKRVVRPEGRVAACTWDYGGEMKMLRAYWDAAREVAPDEAAKVDEGTIMRNRTPEELTDLWARVGIDDVTTGELWASASYEDFDDLWAPFPTGIGPAGAFCAALDADRQAELKAALAKRLDDPSGPFELRARAWYVAGRA